MGSNPGWGLIYIYIYWTSICTMTPTRINMLEDSNEPEWLQKAFKDAAFLHIDYTIPKLVIKRETELISVRTTTSTVSCTDENTETRSEGALEAYVKIINQETSPQFSVIKEEGKKVAYDINNF